MKDNNTEVNNNKNKKGSKSLYGVPSEETFFSFVHALRAFAGETDYLLSTKKITHVLTGKSNNGPIEHHFSSNRHLGGRHLALDVSTFANNK